MAWVGEDLEAEHQDFEPSLGSLGSTNFGIFAHVIPSQVDGRAALATIWKKNTMEGNPTMADDAVDPFEEVVRNLIDNYLDAETSAAVQEWLSHLIACRLAVKMLEEFAAGARDRREPEGNERSRDMANRIEELRAQFAAAKQKVGERVAHEFGLSDAAKIEAKTEQLYEEFRERLIVETAEPRVMTRQEWMASLTPRGQLMAVASEIEDQLLDMLDGK